MADDSGDLEQRVAELEDRIDSTSTAKTYGRRGVLAALGVAALGTGSASAQASGAVGTSSNPVDVEGYDVTAANTFTDPAGVSHSGELADISDVGASGQWQEVNSGSNIEPIDGEIVGTGSETAEFGSVSTEKQNNTRIAEPGNIQSKLNEVGNLSNVGYGDGLARGKVIVKPGTEYDPGSTLNVPVGVTLDASHALFNPSSDYDGVFLDNAAHAYIYAITERDKYTSRIVYIDTSQSTNGKYNTGQQGGNAQGAAYASVVHWGDPFDAGAGASATQGGETVAMIDGSGAGIFVPAWDVASIQAGTGVRLDVQNGGFVNTPINVFINGCHTAVRHTDGGGTGEARSQLRGTIQLGNEYGIHNETSNSSVSFTGAFWDPQNVTTAIAGREITITATQKPNLESWVGEGYTDGSVLQIVRTFGRYGEQIYNGTFDNCWRRDLFSGDFRLYRNGDLRMRLGNTSTTNGFGSLFELFDGNGNAVSLTADNGELVATDNAGNTTTIS